MNKHHTTAGPELSVAYLPIDTIKPDPANPRSHKPPQVAAIARSINTFGFNVPLLVDEQQTIIAGHGRLAAARKLGLTSVSVIELTHLSEQQRKAYMIADNRLTDLSSWNDQLLGEVLRDLSVADLDFELDAIGFSVGEIDFRIGGLSDGTDDDPADAPVSIDAAAVTCLATCGSWGRTVSCAAVRSMGSHGTS